MRASSFEISTLVFVAVFLSSCVTCPRRTIEVVINPALASGPIGGHLIVGHLDIARHSYSSEIKCDLEAFLPTLKFNSMPEGPGFIVDIHITEREIMHNFLAMNALLMIMNISHPAKPGLALLTIIITNETKDTIASPYILKRCIDECMRLAETELHRAVERKENNE